MKKIVIIIITILLGIAILYAFSKKEEPTKATDEPVELIIKKVETSIAETINYQETIFATGKLASKEEVKLSFKTGGIIKSIKVSEGQYVRRGQLLAELNLNEIDAQVQQAELGVQKSNITIANAKLALKIAERDFRNTKGLYVDKVATLEQLENAQLQLSNAKNQLQAAQTGLDYSKKTSDIASFNLQHSKIIAPSNGIILKKAATANELIGPGTPVFLFGSKDKAQVVRVNLTDKDIIHINLLDQAILKFDPYPNHEFKGVVREIASTADPYTGTYQVEVEVRSEGKKLLSGFISEVQILTKASSQLIQVPINALITADKGIGELFTIVDGKAKRTKIEILKIEGENILLKNGLTAGQEVITKGGGYLQEGERVEVVN